MKGMHIKADETIEFVKPEGKKFSLEELQKYVGGYVELIRLPQGDLYVDEDGTLKGLPVNIPASTIAGRMIVGDVLLVVK